MAGRPWRPDLPLAVVEASAAWHGLDEAITEAAAVLAGAADAAAGPLEVEVSDAFRIQVGVRVEPGCALPEGVRRVPAPAAGMRIEHTGRLCELSVSADAVRYVLHRFEGAQSDDNAVTIVI